MDIIVYKKIKIASLNTTENQCQLEYHDMRELCNSTRTSVDMDGTLKFGRYKVGGTQNPHSFTETEIFL